MLFLSSLDKLFLDAYIIFQKGVDNFEIEHMLFFGKGCSFPVNKDKLIALVTYYCEIDTVVTSSSDNALRGVGVKLTLVLPKGGLYQPPLTVIALVLKIAQPRGKIAPGTFKFILSLHFSEKISNLPPTPGVG